MAPGPDRNQVRLVGGEHSHRDRSHPYFPERLPFISDHLYVGLPIACVWAFVCFALVCLNIYLPFIQLLLFEKGTSVSSLNS